MTTLYLTHPDSFIKVESSHLQVFEGQKLEVAIPIKQVSAIVLFNYCQKSKRAINFALSHRIPVAFLVDQGYYLARVDAEIQHQRYHQMRHKECCSNPEFTRSIAESLVRAKLYNSRALLLRSNRYQDSASVREAIEILTQLIDNLPMADNLKALWHYEAKATALYYKALGSLLPSSFQFDRRHQQLPVDRINSILNLGYALLSQQLYTFVQELGLDTNLGNLHTSCQNHTPLICDLMEQFRAPVVEDLVIKLIDRECLKLDDFALSSNGSGLYLSANALKKFLKHWDEKLQTAVTHFSVGEVTYRHCFQLQAREYFAYLSGNIDCYRPMLLEA